MHPNYYLSPLTVALALGMVSSVKAATPVPLQQASFAQVQQQFQLTFPGMRATRSPANNSLQFINQHQDHNKINHVRMQQYFQGYAVHGGYAIMHSKKAVASLAGASADVAMTGTIYEGLSKELGTAPINFAQNGSHALRQFTAQYPAAQQSEEQVTPMIYIDAQHKAHWAYKMSVLITYKNQIPARPTTIIDASTGKPFVTWNDVKTERVAAKGIGFGGNHKVGEFKYGKDLPALELTRDNDAHLCYMENDNVKVVDMMHSYSSKNKAMNFACTDAVEGQTGTYLTGYEADGYDKDNGAYSPTNDALYAGYVIKHLYLDWYNVDALTRHDGSPMQLVMRVHYGEGYENAYWDGKQMTFGDGENMMYPLVSLGVGAHEISHGFTEQHSNLEYYGQSGGMNEAFSDMAAQAAEYYSVGKNSWQIGPEIMKEDSGYDALRYMDQPSRDGSSIDSAADYTYWLDVHYSSGVFNHLFYLMATKEGWDVRKAFDVMVKANMDYWTPYSSLMKWLRCVKCC